MNKTVTIIVAIVVVLVVAGGSFYGGMLYGKSQATPTTPEEMFAQFRGQRGAGQFSGGGQAPSGVQGGQVRIGGFGGGTTGTVENIDEDVLIISTDDGPVKVLVTDTTMVQITRSASVDELELGSTVVVAGSRNDDGSITARSIQPMRQIEQD